MSVLLAAPAVGIILLQALPFKRAMNAAFLMAQIQVSCSSNGEYREKNLTLYNRLPWPFRFYQPMRKAISHGHLSSLDNFCSNGLSTGDF